MNDRVESLSHDKLDRLLFFLLSFIICLGTYLSFSALNKIINALFNKKREIKRMLIMKIFCHLKVSKLVKNWRLAL